MAHVHLAPGLIFVLLALAPGSDADADDAPPSGPPAAAPAQPAPPPTPEHTADSVLAAVGAKDDAALQALSAQDIPDPWLVADALIRRGEHDAAEAFAKAALRVDTEALPGYVASRRGVADDPTRRELVAMVNEALAAQRPAAALEALGRVEALSSDDVVGLRIATGRGYLLGALRREEEAVVAFLSAAEAAERLGWIARASVAYDQAGHAALRDSRFAAAQSAWERALAICERRTDRAGAAGTLANLGIAGFSLGNYDTALAHLERAHSAFTSLGLPAGSANTLITMGMIHSARGDHAKALTTLEPALETLEAVGDKFGAAYTLANIGHAHFGLSNYPQALAIHERVLATWTTLRNPRGVGNALSSIGLVHFSLGDYEKALESHERALATKEASGDRAGVGLTLDHIALVSARRGDFTRALDLHQRSLAVAEELGDRAGAALTLRNIGSVQYALGDHAMALATFERELALHEALGAKTGAAGALGSIGLIHQALGDYAKALSTQERALTAMEALGAKASAALTLSNIGNVYLHLGDAAKALAIHERALAAKDALGDRAGAALTLSNIGIDHLAMGNHEAALATFERALAAQDALGDKAGMARTLTHMGGVDYARNNYAKALSTYERALAAVNTLGTKALAATILGDIANTHAALGDPAKALLLYERVYVEVEAVGDKAFAALTLGHIGRVHYALGDYARALDFERRTALALASVVQGLGAEEGAGAREPLAFIYDVGALAAVAINDASELAFFLESGRAGALLEGLEARETLWSAAVPTELRAAELKASAAETASTKALRQAIAEGDRANIRVRKLELDAAVEQVSTVVARIQREAKAGAALIYPEAATLNQMRATLVEGDVLVLYGMLQDGVCALVVTPTEARIHRLGAVDKIEDAVRALALDDRRSDPSAALTSLSTLVVAPLGLPATTRRLFVSPSGALGHVPFALLAQDAAVSYVPSGTTYRLLLAEKPLRGEGVLALGDPDYQTKVDEQAVAVHRGGVKHLPPLPGTREEATSVGTVTLLGAEATEAGLRAALKQRPRWRAVHLACHGFVHPERPALSSLALTPSGDTDGFLSALDVFRLKIPADLVVLSACETGKGRMVQTEGIVGLTRAFMFAGSPRILCSLWKVPDEATSALMTTFYELWNPKGGKSGLPTAEALRQAQAHVRAQENWKHPYYWAAWVLWGLPD